MGWPSSADDREERALGPVLRVGRGVKQSRTEDFAGRNKRPSEALSGAD